MDSLCSAFQKLAASCEGGTMLQDLDTGPAPQPMRDITRPQMGRIAGAGRMGITAPRATWQTDPYSRQRPQDALDATALAASIDTISNVYTTIPESCGCPPPTRDNIYAGVVQTAKDRNRWDDAPIEEVRQRVANMASHGTEDNQWCVPWRYCPRNTLHLPATTVEGEQYDADFVIVAPSPQRYYNGETIVFTPKVAVQPSACLLSVITTLECKFKACWEMAHLVSLTGTDRDQRVRYSAKLLSSLARARNVPDETPWAIIRPFKRPPNTIAPPVNEETMGLVLQPVENPDGAAQAALQDVLAGGGAQDTTVDLNNKSEQLPPPPQPQQPSAPVFRTAAAVTPLEGMPFQAAGGQEMQPPMQPQVQQQQQQQQQAGQAAFIAAAMPLPDADVGMDD